MRVGARFLLVLDQPGPCAACAVVSCGAVYGVGMIVDCCVFPVSRVVSVPGDAGDGSVRGHGSTRGVGGELGEGVLCALMWTGVLPTKRAHAHV